MTDKLATWPAQQDKTQKSSNKDGTKALQRVSMGDRKYKGEG